MLWPFGDRIVKGAFEPSGVDDNKSILLEVPAGKLFDITILNIINGFLRIFTHYNDDAYERETLDAV